MDTTLPSSGLHLLAHTPNSRFNSPFSGMKNPHVEQGLPSAVLVDSDFGPCGPSYQRFAVCDRPSGVNTCLRDRSNSSTASSTSSSDVTGCSESSETSVFSDSSEAFPSIAGSCTVSSATDGLSSVSSDVSASCVLRKPSSMRGSSGSVPIESVTAKSPGSRRSFQGIHFGGRRALSVGTRDDSLTVQWSSSTSWYNVTDHCQPS